MPTTYAHYRFGCDVYNLLDPALQRAVDRHRPLYDLGVHGPDVLFYYRPLKHNHVKNLGRACHRTRGDLFFAHCAEVVNRLDDRAATSPVLRKGDAPRAYMAYLLGVLCHYMLDRSCHPYVYCKQEEGVSHSAIEASFDRHLMVLDGLDPLKYSPTHHLKPSHKAALVMRDFYPLLTEREIYGAQVSMLWILRALAIRPPLRPLFMELASLGHSRDLFITTRPNHDCVDSDLRLKELYDEALILAPDMLAQLLAHLQDGTPFGPEFNHTFGKD